jgi:hypothetical protein
MLYCSQKENNKIKENGDMEKRKKIIYDAIVSVSQGETDFHEGFDWLFAFMARNPESETVKDFINYHIFEQGSPLTDDGEPCFTYLINKEFITLDWVEENEIDDFLAQTGD